MDLLNKVFQFLDAQNKVLSAVSSLIAAACSIATIVLALIVFLGSRAHEKKAKELIEELRIALVMIATVKGGAETGKRIYDEYKKTLLNHAEKKGSEKSP